MSIARIAIIISVIAVVVVGVVLIVGRQPKSIAPAPMKASQNEPGILRYLPLGDSYTIGESVSPEQRWPNQLVQKLTADGVRLRIVHNPAVTGYTSQDLIDSELPLVAKLQPDVVSVQIGVNDYVQGVPASVFQKNLKLILDRLQQQVAQPKNIFLVTIPDYAKTSNGARYGSPAAATAAITQFNQIIVQEAAARDLAVADIFPISQKVVSDPTLTARDGLHPSGAQYVLWTEEIYAALKLKSLLQSSVNQPIE